MQEVNGLAAAGGTFYEWIISQYRPVASDL